VWILETVTFVSCVMEEQYTHSSRFADSQNKRYFYRKSNRDPRIAIIWQCSVYDVLGACNRIMWPSFMRSLICYTNIDTMFLGTCRITTNHMFFSFQQDTIRAHTAYSSVCCFENFWWQNNKQRIVASTFDKSEPLWLWFAERVKRQIAQ